MAANINDQVVQLVAAMQELRQENQTLRDEVARDRQQIVALQANPAPVNAPVVPIAAAIPRVMPDKLQPFAGVRGESIKTWLFQFE